jgi:phosphate transport system protein
MPQRVAMTQTRSAFVDELTRLERQTLGALDLVAGTLERALESVREQNLALARTVLVDDDRIDGCYLDVNDRIVTLLATEAPVATDLRLATALVYVMGDIERMGDQCVNLAKMVLVAGEEATPDPPLLMCVERMGGLAVEEVHEAKHAFALRDPELAADLARHHEELARLDREVFRLATQAGPQAHEHGWAMSMVLIARAVKRIGENAVEIGEQAAFVATGRLR